MMAASEAGDQKRSLVAEDLKVEMPMKTATVKFDLLYRADGDGCTDLPIGDDAADLEVVWERKDLLFQNAASSAPEKVKESHGTDGSDSETDPDVASYIKDFNKRKKKGGRVNGEYIYYDESLCCIRNIHCSSISLTGYGSVKHHKDFGQRKVMGPILTAEERAMLGIPNSVSCTSLVPSISEPLQDSSEHQIIPLLEKASIE